MRVERLDYDLPPELVAQTPAPEREAARLMVVPAAASPRHATIADLDAHVPEGSLVVVNDTKVLRARILGVKEGSGGKTEIFLQGINLTNEAIVANGVTAVTNGNQVVTYKPPRQWVGGLRFRF